jgi:hypothetical protein
MSMNVVRSQSKNRSPDATGRRVEISRETRNIMTTFRAIRRYINSIPFPITAKQYYPFHEFAAELKDKELCSAESWDLLRTKHPHFIIPSNRNDWLKSLRDHKDGQDGELETRAQEIASLARRRDITDIYSVGVGAAGLEYFIKKHEPSLRITASDYNPAGVERLQQVFTECDAITRFDMMEQDWRSMGGGMANALVLMFRLEPHFSNRQWRSIFENMAHSRVQSILFIPHRIMTFLYYYELRKKNLRSLLSGDAPSFTGYIRNDKVYPRLWADHYVCENVVLGQLRAFFLSLPE